MASTIESKISYILPDEWRDKYSELTMTLASDNSERYFGLNKDTEEKDPIKGASVIIEQAVRDAFGFEPTKLEVEPLDDYPGGTWQRQHDANPELWDSRLEAGRLKTQLFSAEGEIENLERQLEDTRGDIAKANRDIEQMRTAFAAEMAETKDEFERQLGVMQSEIDELREQVDNSDDKANPQRAGRWNRFSGRIGNTLLGYQVKAHNGFHNIVDRNDRLVVEEVETYGYPPESERAGALAVGSIALAGAGVLLGWLIWGRHGSHAPNHQLQEIISQNKHQNSELHSLKTEVHHMHHTLSHDSKIIRENQQDHKVLLHNRAVLKQIHEQAHTIQKMERAEESGGFAAAGSETAANTIAGKVSLSDWPWTVAHHYRPGTEMNLISRAMNQYGHGAHFVKVGNTTEIALGNGRIVNLQQMRQINAIIAKLGSR